MRHYETLFIVSPELPEEDTAVVVDKFRGILEDGGAAMAKIEDWGRRRLAYEVKKFNKGHYVLFDYGADPTAVNEMERNFKIDERVIRYLTVKQSDFFDEEAFAQAQAEAAAKAEAEAAAKAEAEAKAAAEAEAKAAEEAAEAAAEAPAAEEAAEQTAEEPEAPEAEAPAQEQAEAVKEQE
jgi:small subunit ribosomal protein S6